MTIVFEFGENAQRVHSLLTLLILTTPNDAESRMRAKLAIRAEKDTIARIEQLPRESPSDRGGYYLVYPDGQATWTGDDGRGRTWMSLPADAPANRVIYLNIGGSPTPVMDECRELLAYLNEIMPPGIPKSVEMLEKFRRRLNNVHPEAQANISGMIYRALEPPVTASVGAFMLSRGRDNAVRANFRSACKKQLAWAVPNRREGFVTGDAVAALHVLEAITGALDDSSFGRLILPAAGEWFKAAGKRRVPLIQDAVKVLLNRMAADPGTALIIVETAERFSGRFRTGIEQSLDSPSLDQHLENMLDLMPICRAACLLFDCAYLNGRDNTPALSKSRHVAQEFEARLLVAIERLLESDWTHDLKMSAQVRKRLAEGGAEAVQQMADDYIEFKWFYPRCERTKFDDWLASGLQEGKE